ncbi:MAG: GTP cyclohydrolase I FolE2 [Deltaproteobacteria bacterium]|nr:GTP cyclohydrolase I FolE2 [Deltaproteobacteria bacterium]
MMLDNINEKAFVDVPSSKPSIRYPLQQVGISNRPYYVRVIDPFSGEVKDLWCQMEVSFALPADQRGLHMSRIEDAANSLRSERPLAVAGYVAEFKNRLVELQKLETCNVSLSFDIEKIINKNSSGRTSAELLKIHYNLSQSAEGEAHAVGLSVPFINACPCTQRWAMREYYNRLKAEGRPDQEIAALIEAAPRQAHTNRGQATLNVHSAQADYPSLYSILDRSVPIIRELLKGSDEHEVVREAHKQGMFCEDNIRSIICETARNYTGVLAPETLVEVSVEVDESVHYHNLTAAVSDQLQNMSACI